MALPGATDAHGASWTRLFVSASIRPHDGVGGGVPSPMKESEAS